VDPIFALLMDLDTPPLNPLLANGLAVAHLTQVDKWVDDVICSASRGFPKGLQYHGAVRCTPPEEFNEQTRKRTNNKRTNRRQYDVAQSYLYMNKYLFSYNGEPIDPRYLYLPYVLDASSCKISGSTFTISPVLSDRVISIGVSSIFVRLLRAKLTFERITQHYVIGNGRRETVQVPWSMIHNKSAKMKKIPQTVKAQTTLVHYLFCKYGFTETFKRFGHCEPIVGGSEINTDTYPEDEWVICRSSAVPPRGRVKGLYRASEVKVAVRKDAMTPMVRSMIGGFFYIADMFPERVIARDVDSVRVWKILMGHILFSGTIGEGKLHDDIQDHILSLDEYIDGLVATKLRDIGVDIVDIYELMAIIIDKFDRWLLDSADKVSSMYDKELSVNYYVLMEITKGIFNMMFRLRSAAKKELTVKEITNIMSATFKTGLIYSIAKQHGEVSTVSTSGDNKAFKVTGLLIPQSASSKLGNKKDRSAANNPALRFHVSVIENGGFQNMPKSAPDGRSRLNPHSIVDSKGVLVRNTRLAKYLDPMQEIIRR
jgi:hypothetical protein